jgi:hypothetical protein
LGGTFKWSADITEHYRKAVLCNAFIFSQQNLFFTVHFIIKETAVNFILTMEAA